MLWQKLGPHLGLIPGQVALVTYGLCFPTDPPGESFTYVAGVEVSDGAPDFERYDKRFDPQTGEGEIEIWVPVSLS
jgi:predicted transcriptional regulator YdeE